MTNLHLIPQIPKRAYYPDYLGGLVEEHQELKEGYVEVSPCPICCGLGEYDKAEIYDSEEPIVETCDNCNGEGYFIQEKE